MALTSAQKADVRFYLGWSARFHQFDSRLEQAMTALDTEPDSEALVIAEVAACKAVDAEIDGAHPRLKARKVGSIGLWGWEEITALRREGQRHVDRIASTLGVEVRTKVFFSHGVRSFAGFGGPYGGTHDNYIGKA